MSEKAVVFVNVIEVEPARQREVVGLLKEATESVIRRRQGFLSSMILASLDGARVINVARWQSAEAVKATQSDPAAAEYAKRLLSLAKASPAVYEIVGEYGV
jgi:heme-degrading monooxygenase HmoA